MGMDFDLGWLRKGKSREENTSDNNENPKHRRKSWPKVVRYSPVEEECDKHGSCSSAAPPKIDTNISCSNEEVLIVLLAAAQGDANNPPVRGKAREMEGWRTIKSRSTLTKEKSATTMPVTKWREEEKILVNT